MKQKKRLTRTEKKKAFKTIKAWLEWRKKKADKELSGEFSKYDVFP